MLGKSSVHILVADDFGDWRVKGRSILQDRPDWQVVAEACDGLEAVQKTVELHPEIVLLDVGMPLLNGINAAQQIREKCPDSKFIFLTQDGDNDARTTALNLGAEAYILKSKAASELVPTIAAALRDKSPQHSLTSKKAKQRCKLVQSPDFCQLGVSGR